MIDIGSSILDVPFHGNILTSERHFVFNSNFVFNHMFHVFVLFCFVFVFFFFGC